jgi:predicted CopG family antitoxin
MPKIIGQRARTVNRTVVLEADVYERILYYIGDTRGAFNDLIRALLRKQLQVFDARAKAKMSPQTAQFLSDLEE